MGQRIGHGAELMHRTRTFVLKIDRVGWGAAGPWSLNRPLVGARPYPVLFSFSTYYYLIGIKWHAHG
jgi:hypothetical protein